MQTRERLARELAIQRKRRAALERRIEELMAERARAQALDEAAHRLAAIVESSDDAIISKDLNGIVQSWNRAAERMFGFSADEMIGRSITTIIPTERLHEEDEVLARVRAGVRVDHFETVRRRKDGGLIDVSVTVSPVKTADGRILGASKVARDITERKRLAEVERRIKAQEELAKRDALEAENRRIQEASRIKSEFVANMSHELRTPLHSMIGFAELMVDERFGPLRAKYREMAGSVLKSAQHLRQLINDVLDLAKVESGRIDFRPERVDLAALIDEVRSIVDELAARRGIEIHVDIADGIGDLTLDPSKLKQILYNYLSNAIKFSPAGGRVTIRAAPEGPERFRLEVEDTGIGIPLEEQDRLFVEFQQLDVSSTKRYPGTGLGLALTKRLVEAQGGTVGVRSRPGEGSTFFATLPRALAQISAEITSLAGTKTGTKTL